MASRANQAFLLACLLCAAASACLSFSYVCAAEEQQADFPVASDARLAGDGKQTRFILDLDKPIRFRAFALDDP